MREWFAYTYPSVETLLSHAAALDCAVGTSRLPCTVIVPCPGAAVLIPAGLEPLPYIWALAYGLGMVQTGSASEAEHWAVRALLPAARIPEAVTPRQIMGAIARHYQPIPAGGNEIRNLATRIATARLWAMAGDPKRGRNPANSWGE